MPRMDIAGAVRSLLKREEISIDGLVFKLHYRVTVVILVTASMIGVAKQVGISLVTCKAEETDCPVLWGPDQLPDELRAGEQSVRRLLLDPLDLPPPGRVPGTGSYLYQVPGTGSCRAALHCCQGTVGCLVDPELQRDKEIHSGRYFRLQVLHCDPHHVLQAGVQEEGQGGRQTPDTSFYQVRS